jgi:hypothetical protein
MTLTTMTTTMTMTECWWTTLLVLVLLLDDPCPPPSRRLPTRSSCASTSARDSPRAQRTTLSPRSVVWVGGASSSMLTAPTRAVCMTLTHTAQPSGMTPHSLTTHAADGVQRTAHITKPRKWLRFAQHTTIHVTHTCARRDNQPLHSPATSLHSPPPLFTHPPPLFFRTHHRNLPRVPPHARLRSA